MGLVSPHFAVRPRLSNHPETASALRVAMFIECLAVVDAWNSHLIAQV